MNLTDEQVIKALECCAESKQQGCLHCPISDKCLSGEINICACVLNLINRKDKVNKLSAKEIVDLKIEVEQQKADIDFYKERSNKYEAQVEVLKEQTHQQKAEIERLRHILVNFMGEIFEWGNKNDVDTRIFAQIAILDKEKDEAVKQIKAEAIKEFAERLIHEIVNRPSEIQSTSVEYLHGSAYRQNEIIDLVKEMVGDTE